MLSTILQDIWRARELLSQFVLRDVRLRYRQAVMGFAWALLLPVLTIGAGLIVRSAVASTAAHGTVPTIGGIAIRSWAWTLFVGALNFGTISVTINAQLVTKIYFPREVLPLAAVATQGVDSLISLALLALAGPWLGFHWSLALLWFPVLVLLLLAFISGLVLLLSCANLFFRDVKYIVQVLVTFGIFFTPVFFNVSAFSPRIQRVMMLNPLSPILEGMQRSITGVSPVFTAPQIHAWNATPSVYLLWAVLISAICVPLGMVTFRRGAAFFAEYY